MNNELILAHDFENSYIFGFLFVCVDECLDLNGLTVFKKVYIRSRQTKFEPEGYWASNYLTVTIFAVKHIPLYQLVFN